jgi:peptide/nickel transport system substrate-binding protein
MARNRVGRGRGTLGRQLLVLFTGLALIAAACGDDDDDDGDAASTSAPDTTAAAAVSETSATSAAAETTAQAATTEAAPEFDAEGVLRFGFDRLGAVGTAGFDPTVTVSSTHSTYLYPLYDSLLRLTPSGFEPGLAEEWEIVDPRTIVLTLRADQTFQDGTPLDAAAVVANLDRSKGRLANGVFDPQFRQYASSEATGDLEVTIHLASDVAGAFLNALARREGMMVSPSNPQFGGEVSEPAGAGPFMLESHDPEGVMALVKNPDHWQADEIKLAGLEFVQIPFGPQQVNALRAGEVDAISTVSGSDAEALGNEGNFEFFNDAGAPDYYLTYYYDQPPLSDIKVRQAISMAIDRESLVAAMGAGEAAYQLFQEDTPQYSDEVGRAFDYDPDEAKRLLTEAGYPDGFEISSLMLAIPQLQRVAEVVQANLADVGIEMSLTQTTNAVEEFWQGRKAEMLVAANGRVGLEKLLQHFGSQSIVNTGKVAYPEVEALAADLARIGPASEEAVDTWHEVALLARDAMPNIPLVFTETNYAYDADRVGGFDDQDVVPAFFGVPVFWDAFITA